MLVVIAFDPINPSRQGQVEEVDDGIGRLMIRDGLARYANPYEAPPQAAPAATPGPGPVPPMIAVSRRRRAKEEPPHDG